MDHFILVHLCVENQMGWWGYFAARSLFQVAHPSLLEQAWWLYAGPAEDPSQAGQQNPPTGQKSKFQCRWPRCSFMEISFLPCRYGSKTTQALTFTGSHWTSLPKYHSHSNLMLCSAVLHWLISESLGLSWWGRQSAASQSVAMESHDRSCSHPSRWESCIKLHMPLNRKNLPCFWVATLKLCVVTIERVKYLLLFLRDPLRLFDCAYQIPGFSRMCSSTEMYCVHCTLLSHSYDTPLHPTSLPSALLPQRVALLFFRSHMILYIHVYVTALFRFSGILSLHFLVLFSPYTT